MARAPYGMGHVENIRLLSGHVEQLPAETIQGVRELCAIVWPPALDESQGLEIDPENERPERFIAAVENKGRIVATAEGFKRIVRTERGELRVLALASVCTLPECRGMGLGQRAVRTILKQVDDGRFPLALWQTGVPQFYEKMGAVEVFNQFVNRRHPTNPDRNPFWDAHRMIYVHGGGLGGWPDGIIDLNGLGY